MSKYRSVHFVSSVSKSPVFLDVLDVRFSITPIFDYPKPTGGYLNRNLFKTCYEPNFQFWHTDHECSQSLCFDMFYPNGGRRDQEQTGFPLGLRTQFNLWHNRSDCLRVYEHRW
jgi:hypothetical protein